MFGFIKKLFGGILAFLGLNKSGKDQASAPKTKKGGGYYLELDEAQVAAQKANGSKTASATKAESAAKDKPAPKAEPVAATAQPAKAEAVKAEPAKVAPAPKAAPAKVEAAKAEPAPAPKAAPAKAATPAASNNGKSTFAPDYLLSLSSTNGRRRPGANMNSFLNMARQVKPSS
ncbi:MAG TPA: hypothetical protein V6D28_17835 [Leptolyngbyaceae cyanobacterium]